MDANKQWKIRRRMAVGAYLFGLVLFPLFYVKYPQLSELAMPYYTLITFILTAYYSFATYNDIKDKENGG